jgi:hypothetical protein
MSGWYEHFNAKPASGNYNIGRIRSASCRILLSERTIKHYQSCNSPEHSDINQPIRVKAALDNGLEALKVRDRHMAVDEIQKLKFWNGLTHE